ncbi:MAG: bis(5'-nucleosyl)-tetraphosphatase [Candidatus Micrarchaeota archaeon]|nr:bis(5'-nucleosyl)-tetraphosphatase [Candidatus Micrarchaeota archaeon]
MDEERSAGAVVFCEEAGVRRYLLLQYDAGHWDFPKGHIEEGEDAESAMLREVREETGLNVELVPGFEYEIDYKFKAKYDKGRLKHKVVVFFIARAASTRVKLSHEHKAHQWLGFGEALAKATYENTRDVLRRADEYLSYRGKRQDGGGYG